MIQRGAMHIVASLRLATNLVLLSVPIAHISYYILIHTLVVASMIRSRSPLAGTGYRSCVF
jgi:hypothetical protein